MKRVIPYPLLLIIAVVLDRVAISSTQINAAQSLRPLVVLILLASIAMVVIQLIVKDWHYTYFIVLMVAVVFILYRPLYSFLKVNFFRQADILALGLIPLLGMMYVVVINRRVWQTIRNPARVTFYFSLVFTLLLVFQAVKFVRDIHTLLKNGTHQQVRAISTLTGDIHLQSGTRPDIYVIILDGYGRQDVLQHIYAHDNSEFIRQLEKRGFYVGKDNHSNYVQTHYSMASLWNFDYLQPWVSSYDYPQYLLQPIQNNRAFHLLNEIGYTTVSFEGDLIYTQIKKSDVNLSKFLPTNKFENLLLTDSPFEAISNVFDLGLPIPNYETHRSRIRYELDTLHEIPTSIPGPKIVYTHIMAPHPPFVFDQNGNPIQPERPFNLWDESDYIGGQDAYWNGYREQVIFINTEIIDAIDAILANSETPPIILVMGDHGPASMFNWDLNEPGCLWERTSNLYALLLPGHQNDRTLYSSISSVNSFRVIFNTYFGTDIPLLEDKTYLMSWQQPTLMIDVTGKVDSMSGCTIQD